MEEHSINITNRILKDTDIEYKPFLKNIKLDTKMLLYYNGIEFIAIPLNLFQTYQVIWDKYNDYDPSNHKLVTQYDISIILCPFSLISCVIQGKISISKYIENNVLIMQNENGDLINISSGNVVTETSNIFGEEEIKPKRWETKLASFRSVMSLYPDCKFLVQISSNNLKPIIKFDTYLSNDHVKFNLKSKSSELIHPKTLVYVIQYKSQQMLPTDTKYSIVIGSDSSKKEAAGFNLSQNQINKYFEESEQKIIEKNGFVIPTLWFVCGSLYPNAKIINLI